MCRRDFKQITLVVGLCFVNSNSIVYEDRKFGCEIMVTLMLFVVGMV